MEIDAYLYRFLNGEISEILELLPKTKEDYERMSLDEILKRAFFRKIKAEF